MSEHETIVGWFLGRLEDGWFEGTPEVSHDRDEILVLGRLAEPVYDEDVTDEAKQAARWSRIQAFRDKTRAARIEIARAAEATFDRKVSWGARCGDQEELFTTVAMPAMTRLRMPERAVLDTLVSAGVAKSRSDALAWSVRLVAKHQSEWLADLQTAMTHVEEVRRRGPS